MRTRHPHTLKEADVQRTVRDFLRAHGWRAVRTQFAFVQGAMQTGEPGMPDMLFLYPVRVSLALQEMGLAKPQYGATLALWCEFKSPNARNVCRCEPGKLCRKHKQEAWHKKERQAGFVVWSGIDDFNWFESEYQRYFGWLHSGDAARGQLDLLGATA